MKIYYKINEYLKIHRYINILKYNNKCQQIY